MANNLARIFTNSLRPSSSPLSLDPNKRQTTTRARRKWVVALSALLTVSALLLVRPQGAVASTIDAASNALASPTFASHSASTAAATAAETAQHIVGYQTNPSVAAPLSMARVVSPVSVGAELRLCLRLAYAAVVGAAVGKERSGLHRRRRSSPAGVRTMSLVALGAAAFTICSMYGFSAVGRYDPSRMASSVASGVGFVGAGVITTTSSSSSGNSGTADQRKHESVVRGLTTAAAIWISAAVGVACGTGMYVLATASAMTTIAILRIGKTVKLQNKQEMKHSTEQERTAKKEQRQPQQQPQIQLLQGTQSISSATIPIRYPHNEQSFTPTDMTSWTQPPSEYCDNVAAREDRIRQKEEDLLQRERQVEKLRKRAEKEQLQKQEKMEKERLRKEEEMEEELMNRIRKQEEQVQQEQIKAEKLRKRAEKKLQLQEEEEKRLRTQRIELEELQEKRQQNTSPIEDEDDSEPIEVVRNHRRDKGIVRNNETETGFE